MCKGIERHTAHFIRKHTVHLSSGAVLSPQSLRCGRPRAQTQGEQSQVKCKAVPKPKFVTIGFSQRNWKIYSAQAEHKKDCEFTKHVRSYDTEVIMKRTEQYDGHTFQHSWKMLKIGTKKNGLTYSVVPPTNLECRIVRIAMERLSTFVHCEATVMVSQSIKTCCL